MGRAPTRRHLLGRDRVRPGQPQCCHTRALLSPTMQAQSMRSRMISSPRLTMAFAIVATGLLTLRLSLEDSKMTSIVGLMRPLTFVFGLGLSVIAVASSIASFPLAPLPTQVDDDTP